MTKEVMSLVEDYVFKRVRCEKEYDYWKPSKNERLEHEAGEARAKLVKKIESMKKN